MRAAIALSVLSFVAARQGSSAERHDLPVPTRELEWGDVNFLSTSDSHGWLLGHQHATWPEPNYSGDYGDFASFATHMRAMASDKGVDLLLVDAGDHHDGSGLVSSSFKGASRADDIFQELQYDVLTIGNHELYSYEVALKIHEQAKGLGGRYLTSNVNITVLQNGNRMSVPVGERYRKFETPNGRKVTAFGVIFDFQAHDFNLTIQAPALLAKEEWFLQTIDDKPDYFVLAGHMPVRGQHWEGAEWMPVYAAIRARHPDVPIFVFGGHTHVRDCVQYDDRSIGVVPGRYLETVAFVSSDLPDSRPDEHVDQDKHKPLTMNRRYIDANRVSYHYHSKTNSSTFDTELGQNITSHLLALATSLNISTPLGRAPHDFYLSRYSYGHKHSALTEWTENVLPQTVFDKERKGKRIIIGNAGSLRFDLFAGGFDRNDELTISPFKSAFVYIQLPAGFAQTIATEMNRAGASKLLPESLNAGSLPGDMTVEQRRLADDIRVERGYERWLDHQQDTYELEKRQADDQAVFSAALTNRRLTPGYVTRDACSGPGDDIEHVPLPRSIRQPDFTQTPLLDEAEPDELIDVVVMDFALDDFIVAVHTLRPNSSIGPWDFQPYAEGLRIDTLWGKYAALAWQ